MSNPKYIFMSNLLPITFSYNSTLEDLQKPENHRKRMNSSRMTLLIKAYELIIFKDLATHKQEDN